MQTFVEHGLGDDIYKLTMLTHRKKQEILDSISFRPGHKQKMVDLFRRIELVSFTLFIASGGLN